MTCFIYIINITPEIGVIISFSLFISMVAITYYRYFKSIYRLVFSMEKVCLSCRNFGDWSKDDNFFKTRVIFYNNGRKTLTKNVIPYLSVESATKEISSVKVLENKPIQLEISNEKVEIKLEYLDSGDFFVVELEHYNNLKVSGRIDESGKVLNTEPKVWLITNVVITLIILSLMFYSILSFTSQEGFSSNRVTSIYVFGLSVLMYIFVKFSHSLFYVPDKISAKFLNKKSKLGNEFIYNGKTT